MSTYMSLWRARLTSTPLPLGVFGNHNCASVNLFIFLVAKLSAEFATGERNDSLHYQLINRPQRFVFVDFFDAVARYYLWRKGRRQTYL